MSAAEAENRKELELLAGHVLGDLTESEWEQVESMLEQDEHQSVHWELERAAAGVQLSMAQPETMPQDIYDRIRSQGVEMVSGSVPASEQTQSNVQTGSRSAGRAVAAATASEPGAVTTASPPGIGRREVMAWLCAAAAVLFAVSLWRPSPGTGGTKDPVTASLAEQRSQLIETAKDLIEVNWGPGKTPLDGEVSGDVVWDPSSQTGYMRFVNLPVNDPTVEQYQLWIIDPERDSNPIDGGVFDISQTGEVIVPIDAKLRVIDPAAFAITIEQPGGVVVSSQERLPLLAAVEA